MLNAMSRSRSAGHDTSAEEITSSPSCARLRHSVAPAGVFASGYENIGGYAYQNVTFYYNPRYVTYPPTPGPEVAFKQ